MIGHTLVGFVDNAMVGQLGTSELAAISLGNSFVFLAMSFGIGFSTAITPLIAESDARNDNNKTKSILSNGIIICSKERTFVGHPVVEYLIIREYVSVWEEMMLTRSCPLEPVSCGPGRTGGHSSPTWGP